MSDELNEILMRCCQLRGCYPLMHRTLSEFDWFCRKAIFGWTPYDQYEQDEIRLQYPQFSKFYDGQREEVERISTRWGSQYEYGETELVKMAKAFEEYCEEEYGGDNGI